MIGTKFIYSTYVWIVRSVHCGDSSYWCENTLTHQRRWFYTEEIEDHLIKRCHEVKQKTINTLSR